MLRAIWSSKPALAATSAYTSHWFIKKRKACASKSPAATRTERWESILAAEATAQKKTIDQMRAEREGAYPLGRIALPEEIADLVCFLASARAAFLTGICITIDGGATRGVYP